MAVAIGILARLVYVEGVVGVLDERHAQPGAGEPRDQLLDKRSLAASGPAGEAENLHAGILAGDQATAPPQELPAPAVQPRQ
jgi:hypothetical protein